jgi:hypothetical protein
MGGLLLWFYFIPNSRKTVSYESLMIQAFIHAKVLRAGALRTKSFAGIAPMFDVGGGARAWTTRLGQIRPRSRGLCNHAHTFWGLCTRLYTKLTAHTLCVYINRLIGKPAFLQIKALAFPI